MADDQTRAAAAQLVMQWTEKAERTKQLASYQRGDPRTMEYLATLQQCTRELCDAIGWRP